MINHQGLGLYSQEIIGGEFSFEYLGSGLIEFNVITYSINEPDGYVFLSYGDGANSNIYLTSELLFDSVYRNSGSALHIFATNGVFKAICEGNKLIDEVNNILNSGIQDLYMESIVNIPLEPIGAYTPPLYMNSLFDFNGDADCIILKDASAYDGDGDSLFYELAPFTIHDPPDSLSWLPLADITIELDPNTGSFLWNTPQSNGLFGLCFKLHEYRAGELVGTTERRIITEVNCIKVGIEEIAVDDVLVFPNPATNEVTLKSSYNISQVEVYDISGHLLKLEWYEYGNGLITIDVDALLPGIYILIYTNNETTQIQKLVKV
ncbi:MAG: T9SS type A sorting domain-containing protein [Chitinophagales bacterium]